MSPDAEQRFLWLSPAAVATLTTTLSLAAAVPGSSQQVTFRPTASTTVSYDSNVFSSTEEDPVGDWYGSLSINLPLGWKIGPRSSLSLGYNASAEWYRDLKQLDQFPTRQSASIGYSYGGGRGWGFGLNGAYSESQRPEDVFPGSGIDLGRSKTQSIGAGISAGRSLGQHWSLGLGYNYSRALYLENEETGSHDAFATLARKFGSRTSGDLRYAYTFYGFSDGFDEGSHTGTVGINHQLGRRVGVGLRGGVRVVDGEARPDVDVSISYSSSNPSLTVYYAHSRTLVPVADSRAALSDTDRAGVTLGFEGRRYRISLGPSYYRNSSEAFRSETWRGSLDAVYRLTRWLGAGAGYEFTIQKQLSPSRSETNRYVAYAGFVFMPWNLWGESVGLR